MKQILFLALALCAFAVAEAQIAIDLVAKTVVNQNTGEQTTVSPDALKKIPVVPIYQPPMEYWAHVSETVAVKQTTDGRHALFIYIRDDYGKKGCKPGKTPPQKLFQPYISSNHITDISRPEERRVYFSAGGVKYECIYQHLMDGKSYGWVVQMRF